MIRVTGYDQVTNPANLLVVSRGAHQRFPWTNPERSLARKRLPGLFRRAIQAEPNQRQIARRMGAERCIKRGRRFIGQEPGRIKTLGHFCGHPLETGVDLVQPGSAEDEHRIRKGEITGPRDKYDIAHRGHG